MSLFNSGGALAPIQLADLVQIENSPDVLAFTCRQTGIPIWPNIRISFYRLIMGDFLYATESTDPPAFRRTWPALAALGRAVAHNAAVRLNGELRSDVLINTEAIGDELVEGRWFNRYVDPFGDLPSGQAVVLMDMFGWVWPKPRHNERIYFHAPIQAEMRFRGKFGRSAAIRAQAREFVDLLDARATALLGWSFDPARKGAFVARTAEKIACLPARYQRYRNLIECVRPKLLLGSSGCYGFHAPLLAAAYDMGIVTAEYQHGGISAGHDAYNFAPTIFDSEAYQRTLPRYLLTYGDWWGAQIEAPVETVTIGYPARAAKLAQAATSRATARRTILLLGDGVEFDLYLELARGIAGAAENLGLDVLLRPHPLERASVLRRYGNNVDGIGIDVATDIYGSFRNAHTVISEVSTGLFEAVGLVDQIILLNTAKARFAYPNHPFAEANSTQDVIDLIRGTVPMPVIESSSLWAPDWKKNYRKFLMEKVGIHD